MDGLEQIRSGEALELKWHGRHLAKEEFKRLDTAGSALGSDADEAAYGTIFCDSIMAKIRRI